MKLSRKHIFSSYHECQINILQLTTLCAARTTFKCSIEDGHTSLSNLVQMPKFDGTVPRLAIRVLVNVGGIVETLIASAFDTVILLRCHYLAFEVSIAVHVAFGKLRHLLLLADFPLATEVMIVV